MSNQSTDLCGRFCPYPVVAIIREAVQLAGGTSARYVVDDPLAIKAVPEELEEYDDIHVEINEMGNAWEILVRRD